MINHLYANPCYWSMVKHGFIHLGATPHGFSQGTRAMPSAAARRPPWSSKLFTLRRTESRWSFPKFLSFKAAKSLSDMPRSMFLEQNSSRIRAGLSRSQLDLLVTEGVHIRKWSVGTSTALFCWLKSTWPKSIGSRALQLSRDRQGIRTHFKAEQIWRSTCVKRLAFNTFIWCAYGIYVHKIYLWLYYAVYIICIRLHWLHPYIYIYKNLITLSQTPWTLHGGRVRYRFKEPKASSVISIITNHKELMVSRLSFVVLRLS